MRDTLTNFAAMLMLRASAEAKPVRVLRSAQSAVVKSTEWEARVQDPGPRPYPRTKSRARSVNAHAPADAWKWADAELLALETRQNRNAAKARRRALHGKGNAK